MREKKREWDKIKKENEAEKKWALWDVGGGKDRVRRFLTETKTKCSDEGVCYSGTEVQGRKKTFWNFEKAKEGDPEYDDAQVFVNLVKTKMDEWKTNFPDKPSN
ncbi:hypothetical protein L5515_002286 [Caenorhabditis briggsae]|uniref:Uncharacterized protein n=1 Tax=Caenorhabditis briggsae TaxID=6238 RepID=A0AAE9E8B5_CAEBR|nr:hypothetical protein L5515_002286 [Caenorhabditis briggsae]